MGQLERLRFSPDGVHTSSSRGYLLGPRLLYPISQELQKPEHVLVLYKRPQTNSNLFGPNPSLIWPVSNSRFWRQAGEQKRVVQKIFVRIEKILCTVLHEAHERQVEEAMGYPLSETGELHG